MASPVKKAKSKGMTKDISLPCKFDLQLAIELMTTEIITVFEQLDTLDVDVSDKIDAFRTFTTGLSVGYEVGFKSLGVAPTEDKKVDIFDDIDLIYQDWDNERLTNVDVWRNISNLIRSLG